MAIRVLIIEDHEAAREALAALLQAIGGFEVMGKAATETDATEWLHGEHGSWDLAILDLLIDGGSGFNLIRRATERGVKGTAVIYSAYVTPVVAKRCLDLGAHAAFAKTETEQLVSYLEQLKTQGPRGAAKGST